MFVSINTPIVHSVSGLFLHAHGMSIPTARGKLWLTNPAGQIFEMDVGDTRKYRKDDATDG